MEVRLQHSGERYIGSKLSAVDHGADYLLVWVKSEHSSPPRRVELGGDRVVPAVDEPRVLVVDLVCGYSDREEARVQHSGERYVGSKLSAVDHGAENLLVWVKASIRAHHAVPRWVLIGA